MIELGDLSLYWDLAIIVIASGATSWGLTRALKGVIDEYYEHLHQPEPWWRAPLLRFGSILFGALCGFMLEGSIIGIMLGASSGVMNTTIVTLLKSKLKKKIEDTNLDETDGSDKEAP